MPYARLSTGRTVRLERTGARGIVRGDDELARVALRPKHFKDRSSRTGFNRLRRGKKRKKQQIAN